MVEVVVAAVILTTTIAMVFGTIMSSRRPMVRTDKRLRAAIFAKKAMVQLRGQVDANSWDQPGSSLIAGTYQNFMTEDGFTAGYTINAVANGYRQVNMTITWNGE